jgi:homocitrate synthase NifV
MKRIHLEGWCRAVTEDVKLSFENCPGLKHLNISMSTSEIMLRAKFMGKKSWKEILKTVRESVKLAKEIGAETVGVNAEDASRTELDKLIEFAHTGKEAGADRFRYCDTLGADDPITIYERIKALSFATKFPVEMHCHNDIGMAEAVSVAGAQGAIEAGVDAYINTTINGYGERAGNCDLVSTILALKFSHGVKDKLPLDEHVDLKKAWKMARYASYAFNLPIPINQPGVGANAFAHESGIHADGALKDRRNYELYDPEDVGRGEPDLLETGRIITTGAYGGIKGFRYVYNKLGIEFHDDNEARKVLELVQYANLHTQKPLTDDELKIIAHYPDIIRMILTVNP